MPVCILSQPEVSYVVGKTAYAMGERENRHPQTRPGFLDWMYVPFAVSPQSDGNLPDEGKGKCSKAFSHPAAVEDGCGRERSIATQAMHTYIIVLRKE